MHPRTANVQAKGVSYEYRDWEKQPGVRYTQLDQSLWWDEGIGVKHAASALELSALLAISLVTDRDLQNFYHKAYCYSYISST